MGLIFIMGGKKEEGDPLSTKEEKYWRSGRGQRLIKKRINKSTLSPAFFECWGAAFF